MSWLHTPLQRRRCPLIFGFATIIEEENDPDRSVNGSPKEYRSNHTGKRKAPASHLVHVSHHPSETRLCPCPSADQALQTTGPCGPFGSGSSYFARTVNDAWQVGRLGRQTFRQGVCVSMWVRGSGLLWYVKVTASIVRRGFRCSPKAWLRTQPTANGRFDRWISVDWDRNRGSPLHLKIEWDKKKPSKKFGLECKCGKALVD